MIVTITMKTPDCLYNAEKELIQEYGEDSDEHINFIKSFFRYDEILSVSFDTKKKTYRINICHK